MTSIAARQQDHLHEACLGGTAQVLLRFRCTEEVKTAEDLIFRYAPGYSSVSILDQLLSFFAERTSQSRRLWEDSEPSEKPSRDSPRDSLRRLEGGYPHPADSPSREETKREDGFEQRSSPNKAVPAGLGKVSEKPRGDAIFAAVEAGHARAQEALERRLQCLQASRAAWVSGDAGELASAIEVSKDESLASAFLLRLAQHPDLLPPRSFARLLPLVQKLAQSDCEDHAVAAMRFTLHSLKVSWPPVAKSLRTVATSKATFDACEDAVFRLQSLYSVVKSMSRSVRIQRTNGPLVPLCRKLKSNLEEALSSSGRLRG